MQVAGGGGLEQTVSFYSASVFLIKLAEIFFVFLDGSIIGCLKDVCRPFFHPTDYICLAVWGQLCVRWWELTGCDGRIALRWMSRWLSKWTNGW